MSLIFIGIGIILILIVVKKLYVRDWYKGISAELQLSASEAYPGEEITITETIANNKWLPLPMVNVKFAIDRNLEFSGKVENANVSDKCYKCDVFSLLFYQKITRKLPFRCKKRGYYAFDEIDVVSTDIFMDTVLSKVFPLHQSLIVYPQPIDSEAVDIPYNRIMGSILTRRYTYEDPFEFRGIREYQTYDTMKSINWNASARTGDLKVNVHEYTARQEICILLNLEEEGIWQYEDLKEKSISMACSLACRLSEQGIGVSLISNGADKITGKELRIESGSDEGHQKTIITGLSRIDLKQTIKEFSDLIEDNYNQIPQGAMIVMISTSRKEKLQEKYNKLTCDFPNPLWIVPMHSEMDCKMEKVDVGSVLKWEVQD